jgi:hypothetical protein
MAALHAARCRINPSFVGSVGPCNVLAETARVVHGGRRFDRGSHGCCVHAPIRRRCWIERGAMDRRGDSRDGGKHP